LLVNVMIADLPSKELDSTNLFLVILVII